MSIIKSFEDADCIESTLLFKENRTLILGDVHLGYEEHLNRQGVFLPRTQFKDTIMTMERVLEKAESLCAENKIEMIVINGDIKHEFASISDQEWRETLKLIDLLRRSCERLILIKGNHDTILDPIADKRGVEIADLIILDRMLILHGHKLPEEYDELKKEEYDRIIIGHSHPSLLLRDGGRDERYKCFLSGRWDDLPLLIMPSFLSMIEGSDILSEGLLGPFADALDTCEVYVPIVSKMQDSRGDSKGDKGSEISKNTDDHEDNNDDNEYNYDTELLHFGNVKRLTELSDIGDI